MTIASLLGGAPSPETRLLVLCARRNLDARAREELIRLSTPALDWDELIAAAEEQRVVPLLARHLRTHCAELVPPAAAATLYALSHTVARENLVLTRELLRILGQFEAQSIAAFPFKGPALAAQIYGDLTLRQFDDLDIWIRAEDFLRARAHLMAEGYQPYLPPPEHTLPHFTGIHHEYGLIGADNGVHVELLWKIIERPFSFPRQVEALWQELEPLRLVNRSVQALPLDTLLLCLCVHGSKHLWERLIWVADVAETIRARGDQDWAPLLARAEQLGAGRMLRLGLYLANQILDAPLPTPVLEGCGKDREMLELAEVSARLLLGEEGMTDELYHTKHLYQMRMLERLQDRLLVVGRYAYNLGRPLHVLNKYGLDPLRHLFGGANRR